MEGGRGGDRWITLTTIPTFGISTSSNIVVFSPFLQHLQARLVKVNLTEAIIKEFEGLAVTTETGVVAVEERGQGTGGFTAHVRWPPRGHFQDVAARIGVYLNRKEKCSLVLVKKI